MVKSIASFTNRHRELLLPFLVFIALSSCVFANTFANDWTMDDLPAIVNNPDIQSLYNFLSNTKPKRPLREITFMLDNALFGLKPAGYHIQQIFWHSLSALLIFVLVCRLGGDKKVAWISSLLFLVHPVQVEVLANISHRKESLVLAFSLFSLLAYINVFECGKNKTFWGAVALCLAFIAFLAKESAVVIPILFLVYELVFIDRKDRLLLKYPLLPLLVLACIAAVFLVWLDSVGGIEAVKRKMNLSLIIRANYYTNSEFATWYPMALKSWTFMFSKLLFPLDLAVEYSFPVPRSWLNPWVVIAFLFIILYVLSLYFSYRRQSMIFFALIWVASFFLSVSNLFPLSYFAADRYMYAPSAGFFIIAAFLLTRYLSRFRSALVMAVLMLLLTFSVLTWRQNRVWYSNFTLYSNAVKVSPDSAFALNNVGWEYYMRKDVKQAIYFLKKSAEINPYFPLPLYNLASIYERLGDRDKAIYFYSKSLEVGPYLPGSFDPIAKSIKKKLQIQYGISSN
jgi:hypothetical protein